MKVTKSKRGMIRTELGFSGVPYNGKIMTISNDSIANLSATVGNNNKDTVKKMLTNV